MIAGLSFLILLSLLRSGFGGFCFWFFRCFRGLGFAGFGTLAAIRVLWRVFPQKSDLLRRNVDEVDRRKEGRKTKNLTHGLLSATGILLVPFLHVLFAEDLISGGLALRLV